jgi:hypothetical protein
MARWQDAFLAGGENLRLGSRFNAQGQFLPEHGNTIVAQVTAGSPTEAALIDLREALMAMPFADHFAFTAVQSYHMTVFEGVIETRRARGYWPDDLALDTSIDEMTNAMSAKLAGFTAPPPFKMRLDEVTPLGLHLTGATPQDEAKARAFGPRRMILTAFTPPWPTKSAGLRRKLWAITNGPWRSWGPRLPPVFRC